MRFVFDGATYELEFERNRRAKNTTEKGLAPSRLTTVRLVKSQSGKLPGEIVRTATTACSTLDKFEVERGRITALRAISKTMDRRLKEAMWTSYIQRPRAKSKV